MSTKTDPRFLRSKEAILHAARELLLRQGPTAVTHAQVAEHAGVGRATVYRHWRRADQILAEAMATVPMPFFDTPTTPTRDWLRSELTAIARQLELDDVRVVTTTLAHAALWDQDMDARRERFARLLAERLARALTDAQHRGELTLHTSAEAAAALVLGPIYYRATIERGVTDQQLAEAAVDAVGTWSP
ncbi:TetR/AcrR family transcriptional regulator [Myceligenerans cantabricum]